MSAGGLLAGIRVIDLTNVLAGPFCGYQLALQGAEVIKVELPGTGDLARQLGASPALNRKLMGASFLAANAGKKSIAVDLKTEAGKELFRRLVARADVVLENFRPGVMTRLGLGHEQLRAIKPDLIFCAISGFGQDGPISAWPAYDQIVQGLSGLMSITGDEDTAPLRAGYPVCDTLGGITAAFAICAALYRRSATGEGQFLDVAMLDSTVAAMGWPVSNWLSAGVEPVPMGNENFTASPSGAFQTRDGLLNISANQQSQFEKLCEIAGVPELARDPRFAGREGRLTNRRQLRHALEQALARHPAAKWERALNEAGVPAGCVLSIPEALEHPQIVHRGLAQHFDDVAGLEGGLTTLRAGFTVNGHPASAESPPPRLNEHEGEILALLGYDEEEIAVLRESGAI